MITRQKESLMLPRIETSGEKRLVGLRLRMSLSDNKTAQLWQTFMPRRKEVTNALTSEVISLQLYRRSYFDDFRLTNEFEKWATVEVADFSKVPDGMETFTLTGGLYAVFDYQGSSNDSDVFRDIFGTWLPASNYILDNRPHFEILGEKYRNNDPSSEEEIWIPVKLKS